jgi:hypothetical protein
MILVLLLIAAVAALGGCVYWANHSTNSYDDGPLFAGFLFTVVAVIVAVAWICVYATSLTTLGSLRGTRDSIPSYCTAIHEAQAAAIQYPEDKAIDLAYAQQAAKYTQMVADLRDKVSGYNGNLAQLKTLRGSVFLNWMIANPGDLQPLSADCP